MPPKAAPAAPAAIEKRDGAKVVYVSVGEQEISSVVPLNPSCRLDILLDAALKALSKDLASRQQKHDIQLQPLLALSDQESPELAAATATQQRYRALSTIIGSVTAATVTLIDVAGSAIVLDAKVLESPASDVLRPSGLYKLAALGEGAPLPI